MNRLFSKYNHFRVLPVRLTFAITIFVITLVILVLMVTASTPDKLGPLGVTVFFTLVFVVFLSTLTLAKMIYKHTTIVTIEGLVAWSLVPVLFLGLGTLKQLTVVDVVLVIIFVVLLSFYIKRATVNRKT